MSSKKDIPYAAIKKPVSLLFGSSALVDTETPEQLTNQIQITQIKLPDSQPRRYFDEHKLEELSRSIKELGILEPLLVRPLSSGDYELVAGERRLRAAQLAKLTDVPVVIREMDDTVTATVRLVENLQREDLNPIEETEGILELLAMRLEISTQEVISHLNKMRNVCDRYKEEDSELRHNVMSHEHTRVIEELFSSLGRMGWESFIKNRLPLLNLPVDVLEVLHSGKLEYTKARAIARVKDEQQRKVLIESAINKNLSLTQINERIKATKETAPARDSLKERYKQALPRLQKSQVWDNPKKQKMLEKLLATIETLIEE
ncbi:MAG: ParB/RepB/Spo0J family partition protein [Hassallia sp. WJT32-NPBG1]|nr:ParB/RepB/Spo0J family partition protein [Hassallia sp. WJT32-NPBG1]